MTSVSLLLWIVGGVALQLAIFLGISFWQHWQDFRMLRNGLVVALPSSLQSSDIPRLAWQGLREFKVIQKTFENAEKDICSFYLAPADGQALPAFLPGQFLTFNLITGLQDDKSGTLTRCYSLSDAPDPKRYRISVKLAASPTGTSFPPGRSSTHMHANVQAGDVLQVRAPAGHFYLDRSNHPVVLIGGGIGITPVLSMLNWCIAEQPDREVWLFYGVRNSLELMAHAHLQSLSTNHPRVHLRLCFSNPDNADVLGQNYHHRGRVDVELLRKQLPLKPYHFYLCGPTPMMQSLVPALDDWGVPDAHIHFEAFGPASIPRKGRHASPEPQVNQSQASEMPLVTFAKSGKQVPWNASSTSLLDLAESLGIEVNSGCRAGGCGTCQTTLQAGEVSYRQTPDCDPDPGNCLLCVCAPKTNVTLDL